ncbi:MAG: hypothetical protein ACLRWO_18370 [Clostridium butyricum]|nr:hypothetical protein [Clostridium butyricum]MDB2160460.1 hypothetical protein [Clostridium butyricum]
MNIKIFQELINEFISNGIKIEDLTLMQISQSINLYKKLYKSIGGSI